MNSIKKAEKKDKKVELSDDFVIDYAVNLGSGAYGEVFRGIWKSKGCFVAIKRIKDIHGDGTEMLQEEVKIMEKMKH